MGSQAARARLKSHIATFVILLLLSGGALFETGCAPRPPRTCPLPTGDDTVLISGKFTYQDPAGRQSGRFAWHRGARRSHFRLLGPLNTLVGEIFCADEGVWVANRRARTCWQGTFRQLLEGWWGMPVDFATVRRLVDGESSGDEPLPGVTAQSQQLRPDGSPRVLVLRRGESTLKLTLGPRRRGTAPLREPDRAGYRVVPLSELVPDG